MASIRPGAFLGASGSSLSFQGLAFLFWVQLCAPPPHVPAASHATLHSCYVVCCLLSRAAAALLALAASADEVPLRRVGWAGGTNVDVRVFHARRRLVVGEGVLFAGLH